MAIVKYVKIKDEFITLGQFIKILDLISSGGEAKSFLLDADIKINNEADNRRGRKLYPNDKVEIQGKKYEVSK